jgi:hypothetical protein
MSRRAGGGGAMWHDRGDAGRNGDAAAMRGVGDSGPWDSGTRVSDGGLLPPELGLCATPSSSSSRSRMEKGRSGVGFYIPGPLVPVGNAIRD